jgi:TolB protein
LLNITKTSHRIIFLSLILFLSAGCYLQQSPSFEIFPPLEESAPQKSRDNSGQLAYIGSDGNVYVTSINDEGALQITDDATTKLEGIGRSYHRISWSTDGRLAFASVERDVNITRSQMYVTSALESPPQLVSEDNDHFIIYIYWSPVACPDKPDCRKIAYLIKKSETIELNLAEIGKGKINNWILGMGKPFFFSWSPDGNQILWHTDGARRYNDDAAIKMYQIDQERVQILPYDPGLFLSPTWSPKGDQWLSVTANANKDILQILGKNQPESVADTQNNYLVGVWSPDGKRIAYAIRERQEGAFYGPIHLYDLESGKSQQITENTINIKGFFWSPDGKDIAYLSHLELPEEIWYQWRVYDLGKRVDRGFSTFNPSPSMRFMINSFNQYAQSHRLWSPDSRYLVYAERDRSMVDRVWVVDTWAEQESEPILVAEGSLGIWSWE